MLRNVFIYLVLSFFTLLPFGSQAFGSFSYIKGGCTFFEDTIPAYSGGWGTRYSMGSFAALDTSWQAAWTNNEKRGFYASPRIAGLLYLNPWQVWSLYGGAAGSWAYSIDLRNSHGWQIGLQFEGFVGIEIGRHTPGRLFIEVSRVIPTLYLFGRHLKSSHFAFTSVTAGIGF